MRVASRLTTPPHSGHSGGYPGPPSGRTRTVLFADAGGRRILCPQAQANLRPGATGGTVNEVLQAGQVTASGTGGLLGVTTGRHRRRVRGAPQGW